MESESIIKTCHWEITKRCNLDCIHCISSTADKRELNKKSAFKVIDILKDWGCKKIYFTGGEPLVREEIFDVLKKAKSNKIEVALLSNGTLVNDKNIKLIKKYINEVGISLDGSFSEINNSVRGKGVFKKVISGIKLLKKYRIPITLYITICRLNIDDLCGIINLGNSLGIKDIRINEISLRGKAYKNRKMLAFRKEEKTILKKKLLKLVENFNYQNDKYLFSESCEIDNKNIFISPKGLIYPCIEIYQRKASNHLGYILNISKDKFKKERKKYINLKPEKCPYQVLIKGDLAFCLNNPSIRCKLTR